LTATRNNATSVNTADGLGPDPDAGPPGTTAGTRRCARARTDGIAELPRSRRRRDNRRPWLSREPVRAKLRTRIRRVLAMFDYPPEEEREAVDLVLKQMETFAKEWAPGAK
jgi:hypothetical protein